MATQDITATGLGATLLQFPLTGNTSATAANAVNVQSSITTGKDWTQDGDELPGVTAHASLVLLSLLILVTFHGNVWVVLAILMRPHLRGAMANIFILNLCCVDLLASTISMPLSLVTFVGGQHALSYQACQAGAFTGTLSMLASTLTLSVIACERLYSIALPMHQAGHASPGLYLLLVGLLWAVGALLAAMPWMGLNSYSYSASKRMCSLAWHSDAHIDEALVIGLVVISFIIPTIVLITVYTGVFRVAKRAACGVAPQHIATIASFPSRAAVVDESSLSAPDLAQEMRQMSGDAGNTFPMKPFIKIQGASPTCSVGNVTNIARACSNPVEACENEDSGIRSDSHLSVSPKSKRKPVNGLMSRQQNQENNILSSLHCVVPCGCRHGVRPKIHPVRDESMSTRQKQLQTITEPLENNSRIDSSHVSSWLASHSPSTVGYKVKPSHVKAFKTLLAIVLTHLLLWCPFFVCQLHELSYHKALSFPLDAAVTWLSCVSYAVNPCLYGCLNRGIREELVRHLSYVQDMCCCYLFNANNDAQGRSALQCGCRVPCRPRSAEESSECDDNGMDGGPGGAESFFQFLQRTQDDGD